jgi:hypothetical protein
MKNIKMKNIIKENRNDAAIKSFMAKISVHIGDRYDKSTKRDILKHMADELKQLILTITGQNID